MCLGRKYILYSYRFSYYFPLTSFFIPSLVGTFFHKRGGRGDWVPDQQ